MQAKEKMLATVLKTIFLKLINISVSGKTTKTLGKRIKIRLNKK